MTHKVPINTPAVTVPVPAAPAPILVPAPVLLFPVHAPGFMQVDPGYEGDDEGDD